MIKWARAFWVVFLIDSITPLFTLLSYFYEGIRVFFKLPLALMFLLFLFFHLTYKVKLVPITRLLLFGGILSTVLAVLWNMETFDSKLLSEVYGVMMPIFSVSFGVYYAKYIGVEITSFLKNIFKYYIFVNVLLLVVYFFLHYSAGSISYFGFQVNWQLISAYLISQGRLFLFAMGLILVVLSGKRATLVTSVLPFLSVIKEGYSFGRTNIILLVIALVIASAIGGNYLYREGYFRRFEDTLSFDINDDRATFLATSGRWQEIESVFRHMNERPISWVTGNGFGDKYLSVIDVHGFQYYEEYKHYAHFTPVSYIFIHGLPFTLMLFYLLFRIIYKGWKKYHLNFFYLCLLVSIFGSFFGANLAVDPKIWFFVGVTTFIVNRRN